MLRRENAPQCRVVFDIKPGKKKGGARHVHLRKIENSAVLRPALAHPGGLEGHNLLPSKTKLFEELAAVEERDRKLALFEYLSRELGRGEQKSTSSHNRINPYSMQHSFASSQTRSSKTTLLKRLAGFRIPSIPATAARSGLAGFAIALVLGVTFAGAEHYAHRAKLAIAQEGRAAYRAMEEGAAAALERNFAAAKDRFADAYHTLKNLGGKTRSAGRRLAFLAEVFSFPSETLSGVQVLDAAEHFAKAGEELAAYAALFSDKGVGSLTPKEFITGYLSQSDLRQAKTLFASALEHLEEAERKLALVDAEKLQEEYRASIRELQKKIPPALSAVRQFSEFQDSLFDVFGYLGPRKYLILFQNSAELRPTGGFVGSYALVDLLDGKITGLFIDDVFNVDGQLVERVIPPMPIQKISTAWSLHDANWFFDFPTSAKKIAWFYEKAGGATVDGVIAITPNLLKKLLGITGPLSLPGYSLELSEENFHDELSYLVEESAAAMDGQSPKVVLRDIGLLLFDELQVRWGAEGARTLLSIMEELLARRDVMLWVREPAIAAFLAKQEWDGSVKVGDGDYLAVVHSNINGYKTDRVIREEVSHRAAIAEDGSVVDTITITRMHDGSPSSRFDNMYQKVNAEYLRVYVPAGSELIEAGGHTLQDYEPPINYAEAGFRPDEQVQEIESTFQLHENSGTHVYNEAGKTVFANWVYVSPGEKVAVRYTYLLPWKVKTDGSGSYQMLAQKQPGVERSTFSASVELPYGRWAVGEVPANTLFEKDIEYGVDILR